MSVWQLGEHFDGGVEVLTSLIQFFDDRLQLFAKFGCADGVMTNRGESQTLKRRHLVVQSGNRALATLRNVIEVT